MAPEHPYPAPIVDALSAYKHVLSQGIPASKICISGDSAGGGLTLATAKYLRDNPSFAPQVAGLAPISPWIDLTASGPTQHLLEEFEADIIGPGRGAVHGMVSAYCGGHDQMHKATEYLVSPIFDKGGPLPPSLASLATVDRLLSMGLAYYARKMTEGETHHVIDVYEDQFHLSIFKLLIREVGGSLTPPPRQQVFQFLTFLPQTSTCLRRIAEFVKTATTNPSSIKPGINTVTYDGEVIPEDRGVEKLKEMLAALNERAEKVGGWDAPHKSVYISAAS